MATPWWAYPIEQGYKWSSSHINGHSGVDLAAPAGTPITAPFSGTILASDFYPWRGQVSELITLGGHQFVLTWLHLQTLAGLHPGQQVSAGQFLGDSGVSPPAYSVGGIPNPHIHFEVTAGNLAPYVASNPLHHTSTSYPVDPAAILNDIATGNLGGSGNQTNTSSGGAGGGFWQGLAGAAGGVGGVLFGSQIQQGVQDVTNIPGAIGAATGAALSGAAELAKRAAFLLIALVIVLVGVWILVEPSVSQHVQEGTARATEVAEVAG